jgi:hypothetical protein
MAKYSSPTTGADFALVRLTSQLPAKVTQRGEIVIVLNVEGRCVAVHDDGLILHERSTSLIVAPDALRLGECGRASEYAPKHL